MKILPVHYVVAFRTVLDVAICKNLVLNVKINISLMQVAYAKHAKTLIATLAMEQMGKSVCHVLMAIK